LADLGIKQVIPPLATKTRATLDKLGILQGNSVPLCGGDIMECRTKLSEDQWAQFGAAIKKLHSADIPSSITKDVPRETFSSKWRETVKAFLDAH
jgi:spectinomycin phosphotransferase